MILNAAFAVNAESAKGIEHSTAWVLLRNNFSRCLLTPFVHILGLSLSIRGKRCSEIPLCLLFAHLFRFVQSATLYCFYRRFFAAFCVLAIFLLPMYRYTTILLCKRILLILCAFFLILHIAYRKTTDYVKEGTRFFENYKSYREVCKTMVNWN